MEGYIGLFLETGNPTFYVMSKQERPADGPETPEKKGNTSPQG